MRHRQGTTGLGWFSPKSPRLRPGGSSGSGYGDRKRAGKRYCFVVSILTLLSDMFCSTIDIYNDTFPDTNHIWYRRSLRLAAPSRTCGAKCAVGLRPLYRFEGRLTSDSYFTKTDHVRLPYVLDDPFPDGHTLFLQDTFPVHTSRKVRSILEERCIAELPGPRKEPTWT